MENNLTKVDVGFDELVPIYQTDSGEKVVYGSELHKVLGVKSNYRDWIRNRIADCDAVEGIDYEAAKILAPSGQHKIDHIILLDMAKEMAMLERNEKGKQVRRYFIEVEKKYKSNTALANKVLETLVAQMASISETNAKILAMLNEDRKPEISARQRGYSAVILERKYPATATVIASDYGISARQFNKKLEVLRIQHKDLNGHWNIHPSLVDKGYVETFTFTNKACKDGIPTMKWTQEGNEYLYRVLKTQCGMLPLCEQ